MTVIPQFRLPLEVATNGDLATVEQSSAVELAQRVAVLCSTPPGHFDAAPQFGLYDQAFLEGGADIAEIERQLNAYVPDADFQTSEDLMMLNDALDVLGVRVTAQ